MLRASRWVAACVLGGALVAAPVTAGAASKATNASAADATGVAVGVLTAFPGVCGYWTGSGSAVVRIAGDTSVVTPSTLFFTESSCYGGNQLVFGGNDATAKPGAAEGAACYGTISGPVGGTTIKALGPCYNFAGSTLGSHQPAKFTIVLTHLLPVSTAGWLIVVDIS